MSRVAIATCAGEAVDSEDQALLDSALAARGIEVTLAAWDDPSTDWSSFDLVVIRSTWDYTERVTAFLMWAATVPRLANPASVLAWNTDKRYLADLAAAGVPIVPTVFIDDAADLVVPDAAHFVVKPAVGAGSMGAEKFPAAALEEARAHIARLVRGGATAMVQPYLDRVESEAETGVIVIDGVVSHAIAKSAMLVVAELDSSGLFRAEAITERVPRADELVVTEAALAAASAHLACSAPLLYARVDLLPTEDGPVVIELELTEPSLFLSTAPGSADRLAAAIARAIEQRPDRAPLD